ncbi:MAG: CRISPR-associated endonuclease Cas2 [Candidatus Staskawiczbacteria bacterium RIFCSPHIGHO2_01_FULL_34_27]|uniref:CRISPR-associated endonuclease Cas2 n=1 Tax=Candidatus Staskawiczbacteria bacterium RIFCSPHIGHO2_01_FULL_34_27 TaxID=1802199 RepID=A0A1G2HKH8_9BACT|nr:MAG: CRISPR-associated endonuclease Cas2 [Candidatus Staskawiczbacteria bacterium RIFCSPHIGHO2_01_FULL_34_27]
MKERYNTITKEIILTIALSGMVIIASTSPYFLINIARAIIKNKKYNKGKINEQKIVRSLRKLKENRLIILREEGDGKFIVQLTDEGKRKVEEINIEKLEIKKQKIWDKKWRIVAFDIPEKKKRGRDALRQKLQELNFYQLQKSVFVCPYPCEKEIHFLCEFFNIGGFVNIIIADNIYNDVKLKHNFKL